MALSGGELPDRGCQGTPTWDNTKKNDTFEVLGFTNLHILVVRDLSFVAVHSRAEIYNLHIMLLLVDSTTKCKIKNLVVNRCAHNLKSTLAMHENM